MKKFSLFLAVCILLSQASTVSCLASHSKYVVKDTNADFIQPPQEVKTIKYLDFGHQPETLPAKNPKPVYVDKTQLPTEEVKTDGHKPVTLPAKNPKPVYVDKTQLPTEEVKQEIIKPQVQQEVSEQASTVQNAVNSVVYPEPPKWEEYVPAKYQNPRHFPSKGKNISELAVGIILTDLLITAPVGIPMICHSVTKMKNEGWYKNKQTFEKGLVEAQKIDNPVARQKYYNNLLKKCKMTEKRHQKQMKKIEKQQAKAKKHNKK